MRSGTHSLASDVLEVDVKRVGGEDVESRLGLVVESDVNADFCRERQSQ